MNTPPFVVLEGIEGAGKSTQAQMLSEWMQELGVDHNLAREPGGTPVGEAIREVVLNRRDLDPPPESELFMILAARAAYLRDVVRPTLEAGRVMLSDRYSMSTFAYQGYGRGLDLDAIIAANALATGGLEPDVVFVLDIPVAEGLGRQWALPASSTASNGLGATSWEGSRTDTDNSRTIPPTWNGSTRPGVPEKSKKR